LNQIDDILSRTALLAEQAGLVFFGATDLDVRGDFARFEEWLAAGHGTGMPWIADNLALREDPAKLLPGAKSALVFGFRYYQGDRWRNSPPDGRPRIAQYARLRDYHRVLRKSGEEILTALLKMMTESDSSVVPQSGRVLVDSAPVLERALAAKSGTGGFIGKNTNYIHRKHGSFLLLFEILTTIDFRAGQSPGDAAPRSGCGTCQRCQVHCPTGALDTAYRLETAKCIAYWTIEHRGAIPLEFWTWVGRYWFGCDICQLVCPWNRKATIADVTALKRVAPDVDLFSVATMDQTTYERLFGGTPMTRAKREGLRRNALIALTVNRDKRAEAAIAENEASGIPVLEETARMAREYLA